MLSPTTTTHTTTMVFDTKESTDPLLPAPATHPVQPVRARHALITFLDDSGEAVDGVAEQRRVVIFEGADAQIGPMQQPKSILSVLPQIVIMMVVLFVTGAALMTGLVWLLSYFDAFDA